MWNHVISDISTHAVEAEVANMVLPAGVEATANFDTKLLQRQVDEGFALPFGEAMAREVADATAWAEQVSGGSVGERRAGILERGRSQSGD